MSNTNTATAPAAATEYLVMFSYAVTASIRMELPAGLTPAQVAAAVTDEDVCNADTYEDKDDVSCGWDAAVASGRYNVDVV